MRTTALVLSALASRTRWGAIAVAMSTGTSAFAATLIADYQFHGTFASVVAGAPDLVPLNTVTFTTAAVNGHITDVASFAQGSGLRMDAPPGTSAAGYSVIVQVSLNTVAGYRKLIDFKDRTADSGLYALSSYLDFYPVASGAAAVVPAGTFVQVAMTRDASGQVAGYVDGIRQFTFSDTSSYTVLATSAFNLFIDDTVTGGNEASSGLVARVRLYSGALSAAEVAALTSGCYANCDHSTTAPILNVADFSCFLNAFAAGSAYANCDGSTTAPVLNVADFSCFLNAFAAGCS
jgi:Concanavalin A-like lectin/glucanases superfamily